MLCYMAGESRACVRGRGRERKRESKKERTAEAQATRERKADHRVAAADLLLLVVLLLQRCSCCGCDWFAVNFTALLPVAAAAASILPHINCCCN